MPRRSRVTQILVLVTVFATLLPGCASFQAGQGTKLAGIGMDWNKDTGKLVIEAEMGIIFGPLGFLGKLMNKVPMLEKLLPDSWFPEEEAPPEEEAAPDPT